MNTAPIDVVRNTASTKTRAGLGSGAGVLLILPITFLTLVGLVPLSLVAYTAFFGDDESDFLSVIAEPLFVPALLRTLLLAAVVTVVCSVVGIAFSVALLLANRTVRMFMVGALAATFVISLMVRTYGWIIILQPKGLIYEVLHGIGIAVGPLELLQTPLAMYIGMVHVMLPYAVLMTYNSMSTVDPNQLKAAQSMGASGRFAFFRIVMPQSMAGVVAGAMLVFMISLGFYITPAMLGGPQQLTMGTLIGREMRVDFDFQAAAVMGVVLLITVTILYFLAERFFKITKQWERA
ncbi:ABC transporter permease [Mycetocola sp. 2940]|uniref:ABC transporter permease n=1 Tax=Mycetocola sp. 2940 TaxID=3156452 RepID=UPI0033963BB0